MMLPTEWSTKTSKDMKRGKRVTSITQWSIDPIDRLTDDRLRRPRSSIVLGSDLIESNVELTENGRNMEPMEPMAAFEAIESVMTAVIMRSQKTIRSSLRARVH